MPWISDRIVSDLARLISHWLSETFNFKFCQNASPWTKCEAKYTNHKNTICEAKCTNQKNGKCEAKYTNQKKTPAGK